MDEPWIPILIASGACLAISIVTWRILPLHRGEHRRIPTEPLVLDALRKDMPAPGVYTFPFRLFADDSATRIDVAANLDRGPVGYLIVGPKGAERIGPRIVQQFLFFAIVSMLTAYLLSQTSLRDGARFLDVFRIAATVATMALVLGTVPQSIWFFRPWKSWLLQCVDGLACGAAIGATFAWYWPA